MSCREQFTISEDQNVAQQTPDWHLVADHYPYHQLRYEPNVTVRPTFPETRAEHVGGFVERQYWNLNRPSQIKIICPRCGADNRNWLQFLINRPAGLLGWIQTFPLAAAGLLFVLLLAVVIWVVLSSDPLLSSRTNNFERAAVSLAIFIAGLASSKLITRDWQDWRERLNRRRYLPAQMQGRAIPRFVWLNGIAFFVLVAILPMLLFAVFPRAAQAAPDLISPLGTHSTLERINFLVEEFDRRANDPEEPIPTGRRYADLEGAGMRLETAVAQQFVCNQIPFDRIANELWVEQLTRTQRARVDSLRNRLIDDPTHPPTYCQPELRQSIEHKLRLLRLVNLTIAQEDCLQFGQQIWCRADLIALLTTSGVQDRANDWSNFLSLFDDGVNIIRAVDDTCLERGQQTLCRNQLINEIVFELGMAVPELPNYEVTGHLYIYLVEALLKTRNYLLVTTQSPIEADIQAQLETMEMIVRQGTDSRTTSNVVFMYWFVFVSIASIMGWLTGYIATDSYANRVNKQLPRPIYATLSGMTRVVVWEAKRTLEIQRRLSDIQWMNAVRNDHGGIDLVGCEREMPDYDPNRKEFSHRIRAQKYTICSNRWGRIVSVSIQDMQPSRSIAGPSIALPIPALEAEMAEAFFGGNGRLVLERRE
ncbi:MAG: hypothetical protein AAF614_33840 [Chloroflexota bacterium]